MDLIYDIGRGGSGGNKLRVTLGLPVGALINCCDNSGGRNLYIIAVKVCSCIFYWYQDETSMIGQIYFMMNTSAEQSDSDIPNYIFYLNF